MAASTRKRSTPHNGVIPHFDPAPSGKFASQALKAAKVDGIVIGRLAIWAWVADPSEHAFTKDLDIAVTTTDLPAVRAWLSREKVVVRELPVGGVNATRAKGEVNVDFITRRGELGDLSALFGDAIMEARAARRTTRLGGRALLLVSAEHLATMKLGTGETESERDVERLLANVDLDVARLRKLVERHVGPAGMGRLEELLRRVGHAAARPRQRYR